MSVLYGGITEHDIDQVVLTKDQVNDLIVANSNWWDERFNPVSRDEKIRHIKAHIARERKERELGLRDHCYDELARRIRSLEVGTKKNHNKLVDSVADAFDSIERRIADIKSHAMTFRGTWDEALDYRRADCVTQDGSLWFALEASKGLRPGKSPDWRMIAKSGPGVSEPPRPKAKSLEV